ncbi:MAG: SPOR domain-containing protein [Pseudomonadota bacterium]
MAVFPFARLAVASVVIGGLTACDETGTTSSLFADASARSSASASSTSDIVPGTAVASATGGAGGGVVEDPDVFDVTAEALWDGRPSFGDVWVAYADASPQSVVIRNKDNGKTVTGALFRRERFFPGPEFQLSSDAAAALGILAGSPTEIQVTALVNRTPEPAPETDPVADPEIAALPETETDITTDATIAGAAAAITAAETGTVETGTAASVQAAPVDARRPVTEGPNAPQPTPVVAAAPTAEVEVATLSAEPVIAEPIVAEPVTAAAATVAATAATTTAAATAPQTTPSGLLDRPYVQVGVFSTRENANAAADGLRSAGIIPTISQTSNAALWRVIVGPATTKREADTLLRQIRGAGYADAFFVTG